MLTLIDKLYQLWKKVNAWPSLLKTIVILFLSGLLFFEGVRSYSHKILEDYSEQVLQDKQLAERYTEMITPIINSELKTIIDLDKDATNVILLNYHNTLTSTHGLSYRYITALSEKIKGDSTNYQIEMWEDLEYMQYGEELNKINLSTYLQIENIELYKHNYPKITNRLIRSDALAAGLYPIIGVNGPIGLIVVIYHHKKNYAPDYYKKIISPVIQPLSSLLDYNSIRVKFKEHGNEVIDDITYGKFKNRQK